MPSLFLKPETAGIIFRFFSSASPFPPSAPRALRPGLTAGVFRGSSAAVFRSLVRYFDARRREEHYGTAVFAK